jgi:hypothetical protein
MFDMFTSINVKKIFKYPNAIQSEKAALATQYGAVAGLGELGTEVSSNI